MTKVMKVGSSLAAAVAAVALVASTASSAVLLNETFSYANGPLVGNATWTAHSGAGNKVVTVSGGTITLEQSAGSGEDVNATYAVQAADAKVYACFELTIPAGTAVSGSADYFAHFKDSGTFNFRSRIYTLPAVGGFTVGLSASSGGVAATWPSALNIGQTYKIVSSFNAATGEAELWVDPATEASPKLSHTDAGSIGTLIESYAFRQGSSFGGFQTIDNLTVGQSFSDVCDQPTPTRAASWGKIKDSYR